MRKATVAFICLSFLGIFSTQAEANDPKIDESYLSFLSWRGAGVTPEEYAKDPETIWRDFGFPNTAKLFADSKVPSIDEVRKTSEADVLKSAATKAFLSQSGIDSDEARKSGDHSDYLTYASRGGRLSYFDYSDDPQKAWASLGLTKSAHASKSDSSELRKIAERETLIARGYESSTNLQPHYAEQTGGTKATASASKAPATQPSADADIPDLLR